LEAEVKRLRAVELEGEVALQKAMAYYTDRLREKDEALAGKRQRDGEDIILDGEADEEALLAASTFPIKPAALIRRCKEVLLAQQKGIMDGTIDESIYADDFRFCAPFVGGATPGRRGSRVYTKEPGLTKTQYLAALRAFDLLGAFPDMNNRYHFFRVDPFEPNRVWFQTRVLATNTGPLMGKAPTNQSLELPPQAFSMTFNESGQLTFFNVGYVIDRTVGNTGGLGGAFGFFYGTGNPLPIPECLPYKPSRRFRFLNFLQKLRTR